MGRIAHQRNNILVLSSSRLVLKLSVGSLINGLHVNQFSSSRREPPYRLWTNLADPRNLFRIIKNVRDRSSLIPARLKLLILDRRFRIPGHNQGFRAPRFPRTRSSCIRARRAIERLCGGSITKDRSWSPLFNQIHISIKRLSVSILFYIPLESPWRHLQCFLAREAVTRSLRFCICRLAKQAWGILTTFSYPDHRGKYTCACCNTDWIYWLCGTKLKKFRYGPIVGTHGISWKKCSG